MAQGTQAERRNFRRRIRAVCGRWYAGEDIFAEVQVPPDRSAEMDAVITQIAEAIAF